jgi:hypothetical protein
MDTKYNFIAILDFDGHKMLAKFYSRKHIFSLLNDKLEEFQTAPWASL